MHLCYLELYLSLSLVRQGKQDKAHQLATEAAVKIKLLPRTRRILWRILPVTTT